jgi:DNA mismatch repair protein MutS
MTESQQYLARIEATERELTGIPKLKIGYNRVFGYYFEVSKLHTAQVPDRYIRKQTLTGAERYITSELKDMESRILGAKDRAVALEYELFRELCEKVTACAPILQETAETIAQIDVYASLAQVALANNYCCPIVDYSDRIEIRDGRHPVVERLNRENPFIPNDVTLDNGENQIALITGPNMAGKSTYMRQTALIVLMAQIGSFVPAAEAEIGIVDKIFTRVGASDDLASGQSTFMVEMNEVAYILDHATEKSLIILDEIGRGTSTFDGLGIAWAVVEHIADAKKCGAKTMFATHYHELTELEDTLPNVKNYSIAVKKRGDSISFLRKIIRGGADRSYGVDVAVLAGVKKSVTRRAAEIVASLENEETNEVSEANIRTNVPKRAWEDDQMDFFAMAENPVLTELKEIDLNVMTPVEALTKLFDLQAKAKNQE